VGIYHWRCPRGRLDGFFFSLRGVLGTGDIGLRKVSGLLAAVGNRLGREINPHVKNPAEFGRRVRVKDHFVTSVLSAPKLFVKGSERDLEGLGG
jgi:hypothetical protein